MKIFPLKLMSTYDKAKNLIKIISGEFTPDKIRNKPAISDKIAPNKPDEFISKQNLNIASSK